MTSLPQTVALRTDYNRSYVALVTDGNQKNCLEMSSEDEILVNPKAKFSVELSTDGLVHIRSTYNNKYWCRSESPNSDFITASAVEPVEDKKAWSCTLFRLQYYGNNVSLYHVGSNTDVHVSEQGGQLLLDVKKSSSLAGSKEIFTLVDLSAIVIMPKLVTFKSVMNGKYLRAAWVNNHEFNQFSGDDAMEERASYKIFVTHTGEIRVKSMHYDKFWRRSPNWIWSDSTDTTANNPDTLFEVFKMDDNVIALRNGGNKKFCKRLSAEHNESCLNAGTSSMESETRLIVEEPVVSRKVEVQFRLEDARIYNKTPIIAVEAMATNATTKDDELTAVVKFVKTKISTWSNTTTLTLGTKAEIQTGIPFLAEGKIEVNFEASDAIEFGASNDFSKEVDTEYKFLVPAMTEGKVTVLATQAVYDIPFSYVQKDVYASGERVTTTLHDGIYKGVEAYEFNYVPSYKPL